MASCLLLLRQGLAWDQRRCKSGSWTRCEAGTVAMSWEFCRGIPVLAGSRFLFIFLFFSNIPCCTTKFLEFCVGAGAGMGGRGHSSAEQSLVGWMGINWLCWSCGSRDNSHYQPRGRKAALWLVQPRSWESKAQRSLPAAGKWPCIQSCS